MKNCIFAYKIIKLSAHMRLVKPKKFLGQHFLTDLGIARDIADTVDACPDIPVLEVGPGMGVMTQYLVQKPRTVKVVEIDYESVSFLREKFPSLEENIIEDDFLKISKTCSRGSLLYLPETTPITSAAKSSSRCSITRI